MKKILYTIIALALACQASTSQNYNTKEIEFSSAGNIKLKGMLYMPKLPLKKIVVIIRKEFRDKLIFDQECDSFSYEFKLIHRLTNAGIGFFIFGSRMKKVFDPEFARITLHTLAEDANAAIAYLKSDCQFQDIPIGLIGCSESGSAAAVAASYNPDVKFLITVTSSMIDGPDDLKYNVTSHRNRQGSDKITFLFWGFHSMIKDTFTFIGKRYKNSKEFVNQCIWTTIDTVNKAIYPIRDGFTLNSKIKEMYSTMWDLDDFIPNKDNIWKKEISPTSYFDTICKYLYTPKELALIKWDPQLYYSRINIPTLITLGDKDELVRFDKNYKRAEEIKKKYHKNNFTIKVFNGLTHGLALEEPSSKKHPFFGCYKVSDTAIQQIVYWIEHVD